MEKTIQSQLKRVAAALESEDWPWAVKELRDLDYCASARELTADPDVARQIARGAWLAPWECLVELQILLWDGEDAAYLNMDTERVPNRIADWLFSAAEVRFLEAEAIGSWVEVVQFAELLLELPGASDSRSEILMDVFAGFIDRTNAIAVAIVQESRQPNAAEREQMDAAWAVLALTAQSPGYEITTSLLIGLLRTATSPMVFRCTPALALVLWQHLVAVWELRYKHGFRPVLIDWLHRLVTEDEPEEHATGELEES